MSRVLGAAAESGYFFRSGYRLRAYVGEVHLRHVAHEMRAHGVSLLELPGPTSASCPQRHDADPHSCLLVHRREDVTPSFINAYARFFHAPAPILGLSRAQQRVLERALLDQSDAEIAGDLAISLDAVKKTWRHQAAPHLIPAGVNASHTRGGEKRRHLLHFLRTHLFAAVPSLMARSSRLLSIRVRRRRHVAGWRRGACARGMSSAQMPHQFVRLLEPLEFFGQREHRQAAELRPLMTVPAGGERLVRIALTHPHPRE